MIGQRLAPVPSIPARHSNGAWGKDQNSAGGLNRYGKPKPLMSIRSLPSLPGLDHNPVHPVHPVHPAQAAIGVR